MRGVTARQRQILGILARWVAEKGFPPTHRELAIELGLSPTSSQAIAEHLERLRTKGLLVRHERQCRAITLTTAALALLASPDGPAEPEKT